VNGIDVAVTRMNKPRSSDATPRPYMMRKASTAAPPRKPSTRMTSRIIACTTGRILTPPRAVTAVTVIAATSPTTAAQPTGIQLPSTVNNTNGTNPMTSLTGFTSYLET
jgi:hypothetical protein